MATDSKITDWHRSFGLAIEGDFSDYPFEVLREKDMSTQEEYLDVLIINTKEGIYPAPLPDGLENLKSYNLITYKSLRESLNAWTIEELIGHYVSYRKMVSGENEEKKNKLPPEEDFQLYAICTMYPQKLLKQHKSRRIKKGVHEITWGAKKIHIIVLSAVPKSKKNALWNIFSNVKENIEYGLTQYRTTRSGSKLENMSSVIEKVFKHYGVEGLHMAYTMEQFQKDHFMQKLPQFVNDDKMQDGIFQTIANNLTVDKFLSLFSSEDILSRLAARGRLSIDIILSYFSASDIVSHLSPDERLDGLSPDERLDGLSPDERLDGLSPDERLDGLSPDERLDGLSPDERLDGLSPDERLDGLSPDEIQAYLQKLKQTSNGSST